MKAARSAASPAYTTGGAADIKIRNNKHLYFALIGLFGAAFYRVGLGSNFFHADVAEFDAGTRNQS